MDDNLLKTMAQITEIAYNLHKLERELKEANSKLYGIMREQGKCLEVADDGNPCALGPHSKYNSRFHMSQEELEAGRIHAYDRTRPYHLTQDPPSKFPALSWEDAEMVAVSLVFDDEAWSMPNRVIAWVRSEDAWRLIPENLSVISE